MGETATAVLEWQGGLRFHARSGSDHELTLDAISRPGHLGASPMELLLIGIAGCTAMDVAAILTKMRQPVQSLRVAVRGERVETNPKYYKTIELQYTLLGEGLSREKVQRAVDLSHGTYCGAIASLRPDCEVVESIEIVEG